MTWLDFGWPRSILTLAEWPWPFGHYRQFWVLVSLVVLWDLICHTSFKKTLLLLVNDIWVTSADPGSRSRSQSSINGHIFCFGAVAWMWHTFTSEVHRMLMNDLIVTLDQGQGHHGPQCQISCWHSNSIKNMTCTPKAYSSIGHCPHMTFWTLPCQFSGAVRLDMTYIY